MRVTNVSNPAAFGAEWLNPETGSTYQMANPRGSRTLMFGMRAAGSDQWAPFTTVTDPDRFGMSNPPARWAEFERIVRAFITGASE